MLLSITLVRPKALHLVLFLVTKFLKISSESLVGVALHNTVTAPPPHQVLSEQSNPWHMLKKLNLYMVGMLDLKVCAVFSSAQRSWVVRGYKRQTVLTNWNNLCSTSCVAASKLHDRCKSTDTLVSAIACLKWGEVAHWQFTKISPLSPQNQRRH